MLQSVFEAGPPPCSAICWRGSSSGLPPMLLAGTGQGAEVGHYLNILEPFTCWRVWLMSDVRLFSAVNCATQVLCYAGRTMAWRPVAHLGSGRIADVGWASVADGQAAEYVAAAAGDAVTIWQLSGRADQLQVRAHLAASQ